MPYSYSKKISLALLIAGVIFAFSVSRSFSETAEDLKAKIESSSSTIDALEKQIREFNLKIESYSGRATTLKNTIEALEATRKKIDLEVKSTEAKIVKANIVIKSLGDDIDVQAQNIDLDKVKLGNAFREIAKIDQATLVSALLKSLTLSDLSKQIEDIARLNESLRAKIVNLNNTKESLIRDKSASESERSKLTALKQTLSDQRKISANAKAVQETILKQTKNEEATYKRLLAQKQKEKEEVERELLNLEAELKITLDASRLPETKKGILAWPVSKVRITQTFGDTDFSKTHQALYNGKGHNGIDLGGSIGVPILSAGPGIVKGTGDTDLTCQGASYGKWVLVEHTNGLTTLYAHLSLIKASKGEGVVTGQTLGYMGQTGYSTGPHLHFTVYATQGVQIGSLKSKVKGCGVYTIPIASFNSYLNPEDYL